MWRGNLWNLSLCHLLVWNRNLDKNSWKELQLWQIFILSAAAKIGYKRRKAKRKKTEMILEYIKDTAEKHRIEKKT